MPKITGLERVAGLLPAYAWPGGYPIIYLDGNNKVLCATCATKEIDEPCSSCEGIGREYGNSYQSNDCIFCDGLKELFTPNGLTSLGPCPACLETGKHTAFYTCTYCEGSGKENQPTDKDYPQAFDVFHEGPSEFCAICNVEIESAYGDPNEEEEGTNE